MSIEKMLLKAQAINRKFTTYAGKATIRACRGQAQNLVAELATLVRDNPGRLEKYFSQLIDPVAAGAASSAYYQITGDEGPLFALPYGGWGVTLSSGQNEVVLSHSQQRFATIGGTAQRNATIKSAAQLGAIIQDAAQRNATISGFGQNHAEIFDTAQEEVVTKGFTPQQFVLLYDQSQRNAFRHTFYDSNAYDRALEKASICWIRGNSKFYDDAGRRAKDARTGKRLQIQRA